MRSCFQIEITQEQLSYAVNIVNYSLAHHRVPNLWDVDDAKKNNTFFYRLIGSLGEIAFADAYGCKRHAKSFGAVDGQDYGNDFVIEIDGGNFVIDTKSMHRRNDIFKGFYVLNIPSSQLNKDSSETDLYCCISIHITDKKYFASFLGFISKSEILNGRVGQLFVAGTERIRADGTSFKFLQDTYEVEFKDFVPPIITDRIRKMPGFKLISID